jgi:hypothetical protein
MLGKNNIKYIILITKMEMYAYLLRFISKCSDMKTAQNNEYNIT